MKRLLFNFTLIFSFVLLLSCKGEKVETGILELKVSTDKIDIDASESVVFTVELDGKEQTNFDIINVTDGGFSVLSSNEFTTTRPGTYKFLAKQGNNLSAEVEVTSYRLSEVKDNHYKRSVVFKFTATWCTYCPVVTEVIKLAQSKMPDRIIELAAHSSDILATTPSEALVEYFSAYSLPSVNIDMQHNELYVEKVLDMEIRRDVEDLREENPATTGLKFSTSIDENNLITIDLETEVTKDNDYRLVVALLVDSYAYAQTGTIDPDYKQSHVLTTIINSEEEDILGEYLGSLVKGERVQKTYTYKFDKLDQIKNLGFGQDIKDCSILVYTLNKVGETYQINNANICLIGESVDYEYEIL